MILYPNLQIFVLKIYNSIKEMKMVQYMVSFKIESWMMDDEITCSNNFLGGKA